MGVTPWRLRTSPGVAVDDSAHDAGGSVMGVDAVCVVVIPAGCSERELDLLGRALRASGSVVARAARLEVGAQGLGPVPVARSYLVFGEGQARALGHDLPAAVMSAAHIVLVDTPAAVLADPAAKRRLWNGLRALRRALATS